MKPGGYAIVHGGWKASVSAMLPQPNIGYLIGPDIMIIGGLVEVDFGVNAEGKSLETIARPLTAVDD